jgi:aryl-alcohol dehydrogenase-like predicted oxidoreductase
MPGFEWLRDRCLKDNAVEKVKQLTELSNELGTTTPILSIAWCIKNPNVTTAILGATKAAQLTENLKAIEAMSLLTPEVLERIEKIMQNKPILPEY